MKKKVKVLKTYDEANTDNKHQIHFTSDEEIKVGDYTTDGYNIWKWNDDCSLLGRRKIVATTDKSFGHVTVTNTASGEWTDTKFLPQIPISFIEEYVKAEGKIYEVELEYDTWEDIPMLEGEVLRVTEDNTVIVHINKIKL